jgi:intein-encoded DNA endonuclease-like protein|tara:strand:- start:354 stop:725 length:372 start_codon:yes stop_codon:yes gene_type:complete
MMLNNLRFGVILFIPIFLCSCSYNSEDAKAFLISSLQEVNRVSEVVSRICVNKSTEDDFIYLVGKYGLVEYIDYVDYDVDQYTFKMTFKDGFVASVEISESESEGSVRFLIAGFFFYEGVPRE